MPIEEFLLRKRGRAKGTLRVQVINVQLQVLVNLGEQQTQHRTAAGVFVLDVEQPPQVDFIKTQILVGCSESRNDLVQRERPLIQMFGQ